MNIILNTDSYKSSHFLQYPKNTTNVFSYIESRGHDEAKEWNDNYLNSTVFFGLQIALKDYLSNPITQDMISEAAIFFKKHGVPFNRKGWEYILETHNGYLPLKIRAVPEGLVIPTKNVLVTVENTDPDCFWLTSYIETMLLRAVWYPTTVATNSRYIKKIIKQYLDKTADSSEGLSFKLHDFGARGVSSLESAKIGGAAHLVNFMGTDTLVAAKAVMEYYNTNVMPAFSIPAAEHSTITSWGKINEVDAYRNMLNQFAKKDALVAIVSDSYDLYNAIDNIFGKVLKEQIVNSGAVVIIRPDSGDPISTVVKTIKKLMQVFGKSLNTKGYYMLPNYVRVIQGDGINRDTISLILEAMSINKLSADNVAFGMGGALLQHVNRDNFKFAMKCSSVTIEGKNIDVYKAPKTDMGKASKKGRLTLVIDDFGNYRTVREHEVGDQIEIMQTVFLNGKIVKEYTFEEVRRNAA